MRAVLLMLGLLTSLPAMALVTPRGSSGDARVKVVEYDEGNVVAIHTLEGVATHVVFAAGEEVQAIASGFSAGWEAVNRGNHLYLKPKSIEQGEAEALRPVPGRWDTNLEVTTNRRVYSFQLFLIAPRSVTGKLPQDDRVAFRVSFRYPAEERAAAAEQRAREVTQRRLANAPVPKNANYGLQVGKKSRAIAPTSVFDDGRFTYFNFPTNRDLPAIYLLESDGTEHLVNTHVENGALVAQRVAPRMMLRLGKQEVKVINNSFDPQAPVTPEGTTVPGVRRTFLSGVDQ